MNENAQTLLHCTSTKRIEPRQCEENSMSLESLLNVRSHFQTFETKH